MKLTNETKADIFFKAAMEELDLQYNEYGNNKYKVQQIRPVATSYYGSSPFVCDCIWNIAICDFPYDYADVIADSLRAEMNSFGMPQKEFHVWDHIPAEERQEARWFFLMLMVKYLDDADNS